MPLTNPFLFFVQAVLFICPTPPAIETCFGLSAAETTEYCIFRPTSPQRCDISDMLPDMRTWAPLLAGFSSPSSVTSEFWQHKGPTTSRIPASGRGRGTATMPLTNPFLFFVQAVLFICPTPPAIETSFGLSAAETTEYCIFRPTSPQRCDISDVLPDMRTWAPLLAGFSSPSSVTSEFWQHKGPATSRIPASGRGRGTATMPLTNPFLFFVQVRDYRLTYTYRSDNVCLLLLPCPRSLSDMLTAIYHCFVNLLPTCGDVETNPGPSTAEMLQTLIDDVRELKHTVQATNSKVNETSIKLFSIDKKLDDISATVTNYTSKVDELQSEVEKLALKVDDLENRSRRENLIVYGIKESTEENWQSLEQVVTKNILTDTLKVPNVAIERIHRIGRPAEGRCRPVIFKLVDGRDKANILKNCNKLRGTAYSISEDFSPRVQSIRKKLWAAAAEHRKKGAKVVLSFDKIKINGKLFQWDDTQDKIVPLASH
ncbi:uncharacterized protein [Dermacentor albipictus]|uniref:uncharacterized protein n=1 Tax=Dermacentor albipictus TaxID=60249 RepID=UPI0031FD302E